MADEADLVTRLLNIEDALRVALANRAVKRLAAIRSIVKEMERVDPALAAQTPGTAMYWVAHFVLSEAELHVLEAEDGG